MSSGSQYLRGLSELQAEARRTAVGKTLARLRWAELRLRRRHKKPFDSLGLAVQRAVAENA